MLQGSGAIRFSDIIREFGRANGSGGVSLGRYRVSETYGAMSNLPIDTGVPQSGQIAFSNFYNKQLNVVVNYYHGNDERRVLARNRYNNGPGNGRTNVIGGFRQKPGNSSGTRVILHVNHRIGSNRTEDSGGLTCAMRTGNWESGTNLDLYVGGNGQIMGAGANGGKGGNRGRGCTNGKRANTGLGISYPLDIWNYGLIAGGGGGGGGGNGARNDSRRRRRWRRRKKKKRREGGGGGGGGQGFPGGLGGSGGRNGGRSGDNGSQGGPGSGGSAGRGTNGARGGGFGQDGSNSSCGGGSKGRAIIIGSSGSHNFIVSGNIFGPIENHNPQ
tara:strand:- start:7329 stop:8315 length:987 start_codon:yes stop_codon:yes gene_type:complete